MGNNELVEIPYDKFVGDKENSWWIIVDSQNVYIPFSVGDICERSRCAYLPYWLAIKMGLEYYINE